MPQRKTHPMQVIYATTHARCDPAHCLAPGLFRSINKKEQERSVNKLDITYIVGEDKKRTMRFVGPELLGANDLRVLQGLVALAGLQGEILRPKPMTESEQRLRRELSITGIAKNHDAVVVRGTFRTLAAEAGYTSTDFTKSIRESVERLFAVSIFVKDGNKRQGFRLLAEYESNEVTGNLHVALNPLIAVAISGGQHARINMSEVRALKSDPARLVHHRLCGWIDPGKERRVTLDTLCGYVWMEAACNKNTTKTRWQVIRRALAELEGVGWSVKEYNKGRFDIRRPAPEEVARSWSMAENRPCFYHP